MIAFDDFLISTNDTTLVLPREKSYRNWQSHERWSKLDDFQTDVDSCSQQGPRYRNSDSTFSHKLCGPLSSQTEPYEPALEVASCLSA